MEYDASSAGPRPEDTRRRADWGYAQRSAGRRLTDQVLDKIGALVVVCDREGQIVYVSPSVEQTLGYSPRELLGEGWWRLLPRSQARDLRRYQTAAARGDLPARGSPYEVELRDRSGDRCWILWQDAPGPGGWLVSTGHDISERKRVEIALHQAEERFRLLIESVRDYAIVMLDPAGRVTSWNAGAQRIMGYAAEEIIGLPLSVFFAPEEWPSRQAQHLLDVASRQGHLEAQGWRVRKDGSRFWSHEVVTALFAASGALQGFANVTRDMTEQRRAEEERAQMIADLAAKTSYLQAVLEQSRLAEEAQQFLASASAQLATTLDQAALLDQLASLVVPRLADWCMIDLLADEDQTRPVVLRHVDRERQRWVEAYLQRNSTLLSLQQPFSQAMSEDRPLVIPRVEPELLDETIEADAGRELIRTLGTCSLMIAPMIARGHVLGTLCVGADVSDLNYTERDLGMLQDLAQRAALAIDNARLYQEAQAALGARDQFLSVASHELKTPMTTLLGYTQLLQRRLDPLESVPAREKQTLQVVVNQTLRLKRMIGSLLDVSRIQSGQLDIQRHPLNLAVLLRQVIDELSTLNEDHRIELEVEGPVPTIDGDELRLGQVFYNILHNALKYSPEGGTICVTLEHGPGVVTVSVRDAGIGIPADALPRLFAPFYRASNVDPSMRGMGIGLYVVKEIIAHHGGSVSVESVQGQGTTVHIRLPLGDLAQAGVS